jgi:hypothetical protein
MLHTYTYTRNNLVQTSSSAFSSLLVTTFFAGKEGGGGQIGGEDEQVGDGAGGGEDGRRDCLCSKDDKIVDATSLAMEAPRMDARDVLVMRDDDARNALTLNPTIDIESKFVSFFARLIQRRTDRVSERKCGKVVCVFVCLCVFVCVRARLRGSVFENRVSDSVRA